MSVRIFITILVTLMTSSVVFGVGAVAVLAVPMLNDNAKVLLPIVIVASFVIGPIIAWYIAPRLRARYWKPRYKADET